MMHVTCLHLFVFTSRKERRVYLSKRMIVSLQIYLQMQSKKKMILSACHAFLQGRNQKEKLFAKACLICVLTSGSFFFVSISIRQFIASFLIQMYRGVGVFLETPGKERERASRATGNFSSLLTQPSAGRTIRT